MYANDAMIQIAKHVQMIVQMVAQPVLQVNFILYSHQIVFFFRLFFKKYNRNLWFFYLFFYGVIFFLIVTSGNCPYATWENSNSWACDACDSSCLTCATTGPATMCSECNTGYYKSIGNDTCIDLIGCAAASWFIFESYCY